MFNSDVEYSRTMDRMYTTEAILSLNKNFTRDYLNTLTINELHDLEDSLLETTKLCDASNDFLHRDE